MATANLDLRFGPAPTHYGMLSAARFVETKKLIAVRRHVEFVTSQHLAGLIYGDAGLGKTTAVRYVLTVMLKISFAEVTFSDSPNRRENIDVLHRAICGRPGTGSAGDIEADLRRAVCDAVVVLVVDEVESIKIHRLTALRKLQDVTGARLSVIYIGDTNADKQLREDLRLDDRLLTGVQFKGMSFDQVAELLPGYHPLYAGVPRATLRKLNDNVLHGRWRAIAKYTLCAQYVIDTDDTLTDPSLAGSELMPRATRLFWNGAGART